MNLASAFSNALSGLTATARMADIASSNISNALTEGYTRRELILMPQANGMGGVKTTLGGVMRRTDPFVTQELRLSVASQGYHDARTQFLKSVESAFGTADAEGSLSANLAALSRSLAEATSRPESEARQAAVADAAKQLARGINSISDGLQTARNDADRNIAKQVETLNKQLAFVADLNQRIAALGAQKLDATTLLDERGKAIDEIAQIVPVKELTRPNNTVALYTTGGLLLLDGRAMEMGFSATPAISPDMRFESGDLSGLTLNGQPVSTGPNGGRLGPGTLAASFDLRDRLAPEQQTRIDALARDLVERFASPAVDPTLAPADAGLLTDNGAAFLPVNEAGLASRLSLNSSVDPDQGGALWKLRDGLGAATQGAAGNSSLFRALGAALTEKRLPASGGFSGTTDAATLAGDVQSKLSSLRLATERDTSFAAARTGVLTTEQLKLGVDSDEEMQDLLLIEAAYYANARVVQTIDDMLRQLLEIS